MFDCNAIERTLAEVNAKLAAAELHGERLSNEVKYVWLDARKERKGKGTETGYVVEDTHTVFLFFLFFVLVFLFFCLCAFTMFSREIDDRYQRTISSMKELEEGLTKSRVLLSFMCFYCYLMIRKGSSSFHHILTMHLVVGVQEKEREAREELNKLHRFGSANGPYSITL
jgi:hypothetical protein